MANERGTEYVENSNTNPGANWEEAISPGFSPAAAAMAAKLALLGSWVAPCRAADRLGAATITWPVPSVVAIDTGAWLTTGRQWLPTLLSVVVGWMAVGDGLKDGELVAVVTMGVVEMTDAVFVDPTVEPCKENRGQHFSKKFTL